MERQIGAGVNSIPNPSRRKFLKRGLEALLAVTIAGSVVVSVDKILKNLEDQESLYGKPVESRKGELKVTDNYPDNKPILVRSEPNPNDDNIIGWAEPGKTVQVRAYHGRVYPGINGLGEFEGEDGKSYGLWFKIVGLGVFVKEGDQVVRKSFHDVFIAGNFLRPVTEEEKTDFYTSSE